MGDVLQLLDGLAAAAVQAYPAVSISLAYINGSDVATRHYAGALITTPDDSSIYQVGSITKTFTGTLLAVAVAEGVVELTTPVKDLIPELMDTDFPEDMDLLSLSTHTSGLPRSLRNFNPTGDPYIEYVDAASGMTRDVMMDFLRNYTDPVPPADERGFYSNLGQGLLGLALEEAYGESYPDLLNQKLFGPLGMENSGCGYFTLSEEQLGQYVPAYELKSAVDGALPPDILGPLLEEVNPNELGEFYEVPPTMWQNSSMQAAGCVSSTVSDMVKYMRAAMRADAAVTPPCRTNAESGPPGPDPTLCLPSLPSPPNLSQALGYAMQRQRKAGPRIGFPVPELLEFLRPIAPAPVAAESVGNGTDYDYDYDYGAYYDYGAFYDYGAEGPGSIPEDDRGLGGVGLGWAVNDWSDTALPTGLKWHDGVERHASSMILNSDEQLGVLVLVNFIADSDTGYAPVNIAYAAVQEWWCGPAGGDGCE